MCPGFEAISAKGTDAIAKSPLFSCRPPPLAGPAFGGSENDDRPSWALGKPVAVITLGASLFLNSLDFCHGLVQGCRHQWMHEMEIEPFHIIGLIPVADE